ncbi:MAG TPA: hypothetical protein VNW30_04620 [Opitutaceae bacterium]|jgi:hypothetical protein|nr:hypothetical protein [Opitutaceae bacterium]
MPTRLYKFLFALLGLTGGHLLWADSTVSPAAVPTSPKQRPLSADEAMPATMIFHDVPVSMVAHIISARLGRKVEIETNATQLISGDFGHLGLIQALNEAAAKAGLAVIDEGSDGFHLVPRDSLPGKFRPGSATPVSPAAITPTGKSAAGLAAERQREAAQQAADEKRIELLRLRAKLLLEAPDQ